MKFVVNCELNFDCVVVLGEFVQLADFAVWEVPELGAGDSGSVIVLGFVLCVFFVKH